MICRINDIPIYYEQYGDGIPVLCIHGFSVDHRLMSGCLEPIFTEHNRYQRIYIDLPGMGQSPASPCIRDADGMLDAIIAFINEVMPNENILIIGESYGGYLTLGLIHRMQPRINGAFFLCPVVKANNSNRNLPQRRVLYKDAELLEEVANDSNIESFLDIAVIATPQIYKTYSNDILSGISASDSSFLAQYSEQGYSFSLENELDNIHFDRPTAILTGRQDHVVGYTDAIEMLDRFPRATLAVLDCAGHNLQIENEALFSQHINDWLARVSMDT